MSPTISRSIVALAAAALLLGGCTLGRSRSLSQSPREQTTASSMTADMETLRKENAQLRDQQQTMQSRLDSLQRTLAQNQEEQKRYRESMTKNFDLLEQSVALTLSKTITADLGKPPASGTPTPATMSRPAAAPQAMSMTPPPATPQPAPQVAPVQPNAAQGPGRTAAMAPVATKPAAPAAAKASDTPMATPVALRNDVPKPAVGDPDLLPPESPRKLTAHPEAKPLYEKGFSLFARKDYDQSVIVFQNFLKRFPDDIYSDNAQFWIAESYSAMNRSNEAEDAYRAVLRDYEHRSTLEGYKTPDAMYRLGQLYEHRGETARSRAFFQALLDQFPDTSAGRKAQREMTTLGINTAAR